MKAETSRQITPGFRNLPKKPKACSAKRQGHKMLDNRGITQKKESYSTYLKYFIKVCTISGNAEQHTKSQRLNE